MKTWSQCFTRSHEHFKKAEHAILLKRPHDALAELVKAQQWLAEATPIIAKERE